VFDIGSVSKEFAATAILMLQRDGKLSLSDDVRRYFPEMPPYASGVTIRNLLNHTSGIRDMFTMMNLAGRSFDGVADTADYLRVITRSAETNFPVGTRYLYSNSGFALLGQLVYRLTGKSLPQYLKANIFEHLDMRDTRSLDDHASIIVNRAQGYAPRGTGFRLATSQVDGTGGAGSIHTTVEDFAHWGRFWYNGIAGDGWLADSLEVRGKLRNDSTISYALGVVVNSWRGLRTISHDGAWAGYRAQYLVFPDSGLEVACFCNVTNAGPDTLAYKVAAIYLGRALGPDTIGAWDSALTAAPAMAVPAEQLRANAGVWHNAELGAVRRTRMIGDSLMIGTNAQRTRLVPLGGNRFRVGSTNTEITFAGDSAGAPTRLESRGRGGVTVFRRVSAASPDAAQLAEYAGSYRNDEIESTYVIAPDSSRLDVRLNGRRLTLLDPVYRDAFASGLFLGEFTRDARGRINGLVVQSGRVRNLRFTRQS
jgi:CubicO group peptidase (beta-lactamase class C family)